MFHFFNKIVNRVWGKAEDQEQELEPPIKAKPFYVNYNDKTKERPSDDKIPAHLLDPAISMYDIIQLKKTDDKNKTSDAEVAKLLLGIKNVTIGEKLNAKKREKMMDISKITDRKADSIALGEDEERTRMIMRAMENYEKSVCKKKLRIQERKEAEMEKKGAAKGDKE